MPKSRHKLLSKIILFSHQYFLTKSLNSIYDIRELMRAMYYMNDKKPLEEMDLPIPKIVEKPLLKKIKKNWIGELMEEQHLL